MLDRYNRAEVWRDERGRVFLETDQERLEMHPEDVLRVEFGGIGAAVGSVPLCALHRSHADGRERLLHWVMIDDSDWSAPDWEPAEKSSERLLAALQALARSVGCRVEEG